MDVINVWSIIENNLKKENDGGVRDFEDLLDLSFHSVTHFFAVSTCPGAGSDKPKTSMPGSCIGHAPNLHTAK